MHFTTAAVLLLLLCAVLDSDVAAVVVVVPAPADFGSSHYGRRSGQPFSPALPALGYCTSGGGVGMGD